MTDPSLEDHLVGLELQLVELVEQRERASVQGRGDDAARIQREVLTLQEEMARDAEVLARPDAGVAEFHDVAEAGEAGEAGGSASAPEPAPGHADPA